MTYGARVLALIGWSLLAVASVTGQQPGPAPPAAGEVESQEPAFSLDDLDALIEQEQQEEEAVVPSVDRGQWIDVAGLAAVLSLALVSFFRKSRVLTRIVLVASVVYLGFVKANLFSIVTIFGLIQLSFPAFQDSLAWYLMMTFVVVSTVLWGRFYCGRVCAFGALTQLMDDILPARLRIEPPAWLDRRAALAKYGLLAIALLYFLATDEPFIYRYIEPFWIFTLNGTTVMWLLAASLLIATVFVRNLYCRYLCSAGAALGLLSRLTVFRIKRWNECQTCKICERACEWGAIRGPRILVSECVRCDDCERLYRDEQRCVHWIRLRRAGGQPVARAAAAPVGTAEPA